MTNATTGLQSALADRYRIERELGQGGMATVYLARDLKHDRDVAIKVLHPDLGAALGGERFLSEIRTTARLQHPHILPLLDSGAAEGMLYYVMPLATGETLRARLSRERQLPLEDALRIAREVADALGYAHTLGIIHRDIKPENVLLQGGHALVADFGIALAVQTAAGARMTQTGLSLGTPQYMSPEQAMGEKAIDARSDIYALGAVAYEMLTGEPPFTGATVQAIVAKVLTEKPSSIRTVRDTVPPHVDAAVLTALAKLPADRFATASDFATALTSERTEFGSRHAARVVPRDRILRALPWSLVVVASVVAAWGWARPRGAPTLPTRVAIALPANQQLLPQWRGQSVALSPDGTRLAYVGTSTGSNSTQIWMRRLDALDATAVPNTAGAQMVKWSSDGNALLMSTGQNGNDASLLSLATGQLAPVPDGFDGEVSASGRIYTPVANGIVRRTLGGATDTLLRLPQGRVVSLSVAPNERRAFVSVTTDSLGIWANARILSVDLSSGDTSTLGSGILARQLADGRLLTVASNGDVFVAPVNASQMRTAGRVAIGRVAVNANTATAYPQITVANDGTVAYVAGVIGLVRLTWLDPNGRFVERRATQGNLWGIELSPDGARVAYADRVDERTAGARSRGLGDVWVEDLRTGARTKLTTEDFNVRPSWSPDGGSVLYTRIGGLSGLIERRADASLPERRIVAGEWFKHTVGDGRWLPDHRTLLVRTFANAPDSSRNIYAVTVNDSTVRPIATTPADEVNPTPSPDGTMLAYNSDESGVTEVYVQPFPSGQGRLQVSRGGGGMPRWARDGRHLYYWDSRLRLIVVTLQTQPQLAITGVREIATDATPGMGGAFTNVGYDVAPDGRVLVAESVTNSYQLILIRNGLSAPRRGDAP